MRKWFAKIGMGMLVSLLSIFLLTGCTEEEVNQFLTIVLSENSSGWEEGQYQSGAMTDSAATEDFWVDNPEDASEEDFNEEEFLLSPEEISSAEAESDETEDLRESKPNTGDLNAPEGPGAHLDEYGTYTGMEEVAEYLRYYGDLPENFMTKKEAESLGWTGGSLEDFAPGMCIGGDRFGNYEKLLPAKKGRVYYECDIDTLGAEKRGAKRIVYSNDGLIYYTEDHYESFRLLYGEE